MRHGVLLATALLLVAAVAVLPFGGLAAETGDNETGSVAPGERLSGVVGVQGAELETNVSDRAFGIQLAQARSPEAGASVVADQYRGVQNRVAVLQERLAALERARANGSLGRGAYRAQVSEVAARIAGTRHLANRTVSAAEGLPEEVLRERGVNVTAIHTLRERASELGGQRVAEIARTIAGRGVGGGPGAPVGQGPPEARGPPGDGAGPANDTGRSQTPNETDPVEDERGPPNNSTEGGPDRGR